MTKREAKVYALSVAAGIILASCNALEVSWDSDNDCSKIMAELEHIAESLRARADKLIKRRSIRAPGKGDN